MTTERIVRATAGSFILLSLALGVFISPYWLLFTAFVGLNLFQSSLTGWCPLEIVLQRLGVGTGKPAMV
jgi:hypothetical protein